MGEDNLRCFTLKSDRPLMHASTDIDEEIRRAQEARKQSKASKPASTSSTQRSSDKKKSSGATFDEELYSNDTGMDYDMELNLNEDAEPEESSGGGRKLLSSFTAPKDVFKDIAAMEEDVPDPLESVGRQSRRIIDREDDYRKQRLQRQLSPERVDAFSAGGPGVEKEGGSARSYREVMKEAELDREYDKTMKKVKEKQEELRREAQDAREALASRPAIVPTKERPVLDDAIDSEPAKPKKRRWDQGADETKTKKSEWEDDDDEASKKAAAAAAAATPTQKKRNRWDETPVAPGPLGSVSQWDATPKGGVAQTPTAKKSRWDETPVGFNPFGATPVGASGLAGMATPVPGGAYTPEAMNAIRWEKEIDARNRPFTDEELNQILPSEGYKILEPPSTYAPIRTPARKLTATPTPLHGMLGAGFVMQTEGGIGGDSGLAPGAIPMGIDVPPEIAGVGALQFFKPEDMQHFGKLMSDTRDESELTVDELKERKIMRLLLKIKNGTPPIRKAALRQITDKAREFGPASLFNQILPLLMSPTLEDQERHLLVKVIDRVLYKLDDLVRPYVHKILVVIEPLLIDEDYYARVEGREIISNLSKAAGLATMIATMRPDIDHVDEYVRNTTARAFSVVASALGIPALMPFLKAVCRSKKSWQARHTGIKIVQQIAILMGCGVLPHLKNLVEAIAGGLEDEEQQKVRTITALAIAALAEAAHPYGIESFDSVLRPLWAGTKKHRGKGLAAILKAIGYIIPLMDSEYANFYTKEVMQILIREFQSPDEEMKKIVLKVIKQCCGTDGVEPSYIKTEIIPDFFKQFWVRRMALDRRNSKQLIETTVELAQKVGVSEIVGRIAEDLKDESEPYRKMVMETIEKVIVSLGAADIDERMEEVLIDGILYAFQEQTIEDVIMLNGFGTVVNALGMRAKPYIPQICSTILWRLNNKSAKVRQQAADLISRIAVVLRTCGEEKVMAHLGLVLYEYLGEEYPEVLGSILRALKSIVNVIGMSSMTPPIKDLLPRCTPILKNRHEKVQENCIDLVGRIADRGAEFVSAREWMRICFELLDMLKAHKKGIRRATVNTFGYIAKAIGPQDVLATLLNNLKVQERQNRVCTTVAIAIVAETCSPFTVLPALMNEYRVPELNVQNGVLKSLSFLFEYIGEMGKDYVYAVTPLIEDALMDRDLVHRQTACTTVKHMALGVVGLGCEDAMLHLLNYVFPNVFETSPHVINAVMEAIDGLRLSLGPCTILHYILQGLYHPARRVREIYWKIFNNLYIGSQDALVAFYPRIENDSRNKYKRHELDIILSSTAANVALHLHPHDKLQGSSPKEISWDQATSILSHVNGVSKFLRGGLVLNEESSSGEILTILNDESVRKLSGDMFEQHDASLVILVKGIQAEALPIPATFTILSENATSNAKISEYFNDFTELIADVHPSGDMLLSISSESQNPSIAGAARVSLFDRSAVLSVPDDAPEYLQSTLKEIAKTAYVDVKSHFVEKFGKRAESFSEKGDRMFMVEMEFLSSLFEALKIQSVHALKRRATTAKLPDFIGITVSTPLSIKNSYGVESEQYQNAVSISNEVLEKVFESFTTVYKTGVVQMISVAPETPAYGQLPNLVRRLATIDVSCPQAISDCQTFVIGMMYSIGEGGADANTSGAVRRRKQD
ncbi:Splicing factor 3B subunit 1 [Phlyctochytrium planicorne]|nr:Splicing factor 3B subunit 1 [Phlyctochytrium planicorne]